VGAAAADVDEAALVEDAAADEFAAVDDEGDAVCELLLQAGSNAPSAATPTIAIIGLFIRLIPHSRFVCLCGLIG
jgi:hypothetical protein